MPTSICTQPFASDSPVIQPIGPTQPWSGTWNLQVVTAWTIPSLHGFPNRRNLQLSNLRLHSLFWVELLSLWRTVLDRAYWLKMRRAPNNKTTRAEHKQYISRLSWTSPQCSNLSNPRRTNDADEWKIDVLHTARAIWKTKRRTLAC